jgi:hypothetical protein
MDVKYTGSIQDMITEYDSLNVKAGIPGVAYCTMLIRSLPPQIFKQLNTVNPTSKTDEELREIVLTAGKNVEIWQATQKNFGIISKSSKSSGRVSESGAIQIRPAFRRDKKFESRRPRKSEGYQTRKEVPQSFKSPEGKTYVQMIEGVPKDEIQRRREAKECLRCAWASD